MATAHISGELLAGALRRVARVNQDIEAPGLISLRSGELQVDWGNGGEVLPAEVDGDDQCQVPDGVMRALQRLVRSKKKMTLEIRDGTLWLNAVQAEEFIRQRRPRPVLPPAPRHVDFLLLSDRYDAESIDEAGLRGDVELAKERYTVSLHAAARRLAWLGLDAKGLDRLLKAHLQRLADAPASLPLEDDLALTQDGDQFSLFD